MKELRDTIRRLRVEGAGAAEAELQELQTKLEAQSKEREEAAQILKSTLYCDLYSNMH
jgi:glutamyl-tRNA reductase